MSSALLVENADYLFHTYWRTVLVSMPSANIRKSEATMLEMEEARRPGRALRSACSLFICYAPGPGRGAASNTTICEPLELDNYTEPPIKHGTEDKPGSENLTSAMVTRSSVAAQPSPAQPSPAQPGYIDPRSPQSAGGLSLSFYAAAQSQHTPSLVPLWGHPILTPIFIIHRRQRATTSAL